MNASTRLLGVETHWIRKVLTIAANRVLWVLFTSYCRIVCFFFMLTLLLIWSIVFPSFFLFSHLNSLYFRLLHKGLFRLFSLTMDMALFRVGLRGGGPLRFPWYWGSGQVRLLILPHWGFQTLHLPFFGHGEICHPDCPAIQLVYY